LGEEGAIRGFQGEYRWLSNFWPARVVLDGAVYPTVEHAYQAAKTLSLPGRARIAQATTPGQAKKMGRGLAVRSDWEAVKEREMLHLLMQKFREGLLRDKLLATGTQPLIEENYWGDTYWGVCRGVGKNRLGVLLMEVRKQFREDSPE
jgi:ribA/ribD-fused uncharacterized protein